MSLINDDERGDIERNKQISIAAFFNYNQREDQTEKVLFEEFILTDRFNKFSNLIKRKRNILIYLCCVQIIASLIGMLYMVVRRSYVYLVINLLTLALAFCGLFGSIRMHYLALIIHCLLTVSLPGGFFLYQAVDLFLSNESTDMNTKKASDTLVLFIFSLPYVFDLICGLYCYFFLKSLSKELVNLKGDHEKLKEEIDEINNKISNEEMQNHFKNISNEICVICMINKRNTAFSPCGHYLCCNDCSTELFSKYIFAKPLCPICRKECQSYIKVIVS
jgi:hypothetical protein